MSAEALGWVFKHSPYTGAALIVHLALADVANEMCDNEIWARQREIARKARVGRQRTNEILSQMVADGLLVVLEDNASIGKTNRYRMQFPGLPMVYGGGVAVDDRGVPRMTTPPVAVDDTHKETNMNTTGNPLVSPTGDTRPEVYSRAFLDAWAAYPRKMAKKAAWKAWRATVTRWKRDGDDVRSKMVSAARNYAAATAGREVEHILHGSTFFGPTDRWLDYVDGPGDLGRRNGETPPMTDAARLRLLNRAGV